MKPHLTHTLLTLTAFVGLTACLPANILAQVNQLSRYQYYLEQVAKEGPDFRQLQDTSLVNVGQWGSGRCLGAATMGNYVFTGSGPTFLWVDMTDKRRPVVVWDTLTSLGSRQVSNLIIQDSIGYAIATSKLFIFDFRNPTHPRVMSEMELGSVLSLVVENSLAFVSLTVGVLYCIDVSNPTSPYVRSSLASFVSYPQMTISQRRLYISGPTSQFTEYIDVSDPDSMVGTVLWGVLPSYVTGLYAEDSILLMGSTNRLAIYSIAVPDSPVVISSTPIFSSDDWVARITLQGNTAYLGTLSGRVALVDITNRAAPVILGEYTPSKSMAQFAWTLTVMDTVLYCSLPHGVNALSVTNPAAVHSLSFIPTGHQSNKVVVENGLAYVTSGLAGLWVVDVSDAVRPRGLGNLHTFGYARDVIVDSTTAYVSVSDDYEIWSNGPWNGLVTIDIRRPDSLTILDSLAMTAALTMAKSGSLLFVARPGDSTVTIVDVSDPSKIRQVGNLGNGLRVEEIVAKDSIVFLAANSSGLAVFDCKNPVSPQPLATLLPIPFGIGLDGDHAYVLHRRPGFPFTGDTIVVVNISHPASPLIVGKGPKKFIGANRWNGPLESVVSDNILFWAGSNELGVCNVTNPAQPRVEFCIFIEDVPGIDAVRDTVYFTHTYSGLWIIRYDRGPTSVIGSDDPTPEAFHLFPNYPNPFNPITIINYDLPTDLKVTLKVFDVLGREVATLVDGFVEAGHHRETLDAASFSSGVYFYRLTAGSFMQTRKLLLLK